MSLGLTPCNSINYTHRIHSSSNSARVPFATFATSTGRGCVRRNGIPQPLQAAVSRLPLCGFCLRRILPPTGGDEGPDAHDDVDDEQHEGDDAGDHSGGTFGFSGDQRADLHDIHRGAEDAQDGDDESDMDSKLLILQADEPADQNDGAQNGRDERSPAGKGSGDIGDDTDGDEDDTSPMVVRGMMLLNFSDEVEDAPVRRFWIQSMVEVVCEDDNCSLFY